MKEGENHKKQGEILYSKETWKRNSEENMFYLLKHIRRKIWLSDKTMMLDGRKRKWKAENS